MEGRLRASTPLWQAIIVSFFIGGLAGYGVRITHELTRVVAPPSLDGGGGAAHAGGGAPGGGMGGPAGSPDQPFASDRNKQALDDLIQQLQSKH